MVALLTHESVDAMAASLAAEIAAALTEAVDARGSASLVASGGSTPAPLYRALADTGTDWGRVTVTLADERWVDPDSDASNEALLRGTLLTGAARFIPLKTAAATAAEGAAEANAAQKAIPLPYDVTILGMGGDGHTASLFPQADGLAEALRADQPRRLMALTPKELPGHAPFARMTMTLRALLASRRIVVMISGAEKRAVFEQALAGSDVFDMPIRAILDQTGTPVDVHWAP